MSDTLKLAAMGGWRAEYKGPGSTEAYAIANSEGEVMAIAVTRGDGLRPPEVTPIARRIVACYNACTGIPTEQLESDFAQGYEPWGHVKHLRAQRDELLTALECLLDAHAVPSSICAARPAYEAAKAAIAKATGTA